MAFSFRLSWDLSPIIFFIQPIGSVLNSPEAIEHFLIVFALTLIASALASSMRTAFRKTILAKQEAERAVVAEIAKQEAETAKALMGKYSGAGLP